MQADIREWTLAALLLPLLTAAAAGAEVPDLASHLPENPAIVGQPYLVRYEVSWTGPASQFSVVARLEPANWCRAVIEQAQGSVQEDRNVIAYTVKLVPEEAGTYEAPQLLIDYGSRDQGTPKRLATEPASIHVAEAASAAWPLVLGVAVFVMALLLTVVYVRKRRKQTIRQ